MEIESKFKQNLAYSWWRKDAVSAENSVWVFLLNLINEQGSHSWSCSSTFENNEKNTAIHGGKFWIIQNLSKLFKRIIKKSPEKQNKNRKNGKKYTFRKLGNVLVYQEIEQFGIPGDNRKLQLLFCRRPKPGQWALRLLCSDLWPNYCLENWKI